MNVDIRRLTADCAYCGGPLWGIVSVRVNGWEHNNPADRNRGGLHTAFPVPETIIDATTAE